jgi:hypothetical protein
MKAFVADPLKLSQVWILHDKCVVEIAEEDCSQVQSLQRSRVYWMPSMQRRVNNQLVTIVWSCGHEALCMPNLWWQQVLSLSSPPSESCLFQNCQIWRLLLSETVCVHTGHFVMLLQFLLQWFLVLVSSNFAQGSLIALMGIKGSEEMVCSSVKHNTTKLLTNLQ